jgi:hypothetical protein
MKAIDWMTAVIKDSGIDFHQADVAFENRNILREKRESGRLKPVPPEQDKEGIQEFFHC